MNPITELKNIIHIRQLLVTRTLLMTIQHTVADDLVIDTTYNIMTPIVDTGNILLNNDFHRSDNLKIIINDVDCIFFWFSIGLILSSIYYVNNYDNLKDNNPFNESKEKDKLIRLKNFIPYENIKSTTSFVISLMIFLLSKNVLPAT